jgi:hypothetical protein
MTEPSHCPYRQSTLLQQVLTPDKMRIAFLLGAGCPVSVQVPKGTGTGALIPDISGLTDQVSQALSSNADFSGDYSNLLGRFTGGKKPTIEDILSEIRLLQGVVRTGTIDSLGAKSLAALDAEICRITTEVVGVALPEVITPYHQLAMWTGGIKRTHAVEVFTPNYDTLIEQAMEAHQIPYFDGFVGVKQAFFDLTSMENGSLPSRWNRLWKVHGSINWWRTATDEVVRRESGKVGDRQMIYPSHLKYDQSRRMPYLAMLDRLRAFLASGQAVLVTCGYSFLDQHLNEIILHGLRSNPTAICIGLLYGKRAGYTSAFETARKHPNLSLLAQDGAILGTVERDWRADENTGHSLHDVCVFKDTTDANCRFELGDFKKLGSFLARQINRFDDDPVTAHAA